MLSLYLQLLDNEEDRSRFERFYLLYRGLMYHVAIKLLHNEMDAEDAVHQAFLSILQHFSKIRVIDCPESRAYAVIITERKAIDLLRERKPSSLTLTLLCCLRERIESLPRRRFLQRLVKGQCVILGVVILCAGMTIFGLSKTADTKWMIVIIWYSSAIGLVLGWLFSAGATIIHVSICKCKGRRGRELTTRRSVCLTGVAFAQCSIQLRGCCVAETIKGKINRIP